MFLFDSNNLDFVLLFFVWTVVSKEKIYGIAS